MTEKDYNTEFTLVLQNQAIIMRGIATILESGTICAYKQAGQLREFAALIEKGAKEK